ncbi:secreted protein-like protein [Leptotrombidium deliense]|uniref:Secreted protein-like protein n=1 Tax=Leptotrombidium deliense TaxID=299467 RepID=A0A443S0S5_9ACAR|nr:secreted protein-like protein [Leptotrombidium deliense]
MFKFRVNTLMTHKFSKNSVVHGQNIGCKDPSSYVGKYVGESQQCPALVKALCDNMLNFPTSSWVRGQQVQQNCAVIARWTAVATFTAPNNKYKGHFRVV